MQSIAFIKFGKKEHIEALVNEGKLFLNTVTAFKKLDDNYRGDKNEGVSNILQSNHVRIEIIPPKEFGFEPLVLDSSNGLMGQVLITAGNHFGKNIFSIYMLEASESACIDKRLDQFGEYGAFIFDQKEFIKRVVEALKLAKMNYEAGAVSYVDEQSFEGDVSLFNKFSEYSYQNEFRIIAYSGKEEPLVLNIGSIKDIAYILPVEAFHSMKICKVT